VRKEPRLPDAAAPPVQEAGDDDGETQPSSPELFEETTKGFLGVEDDVEHGVLPHARKELMRVLG